MATLQEIKLKDLTKDVKKILKYYELSYFFQPATERSGGLLTIWSNEEQAVLKERNETCIITEFPNLNLYAVNMYIRTENYVNWCSQLLHSIQSIQSEANIVMMGDINGYEDATRDRIGQKLTSSDVHLKVYRRLKPVLEELNLEDLAVNLNSCKPTHYCKTTNTQCRLDYIFTNDFFINPTITIHDVDLSDHAIVEAELGETDKEDTGPGVWRHNNNVLQSNYEFIQRFLNEENVSRDNYDAMKQKLRDNLRNICLTKSILEKQYMAHLKQRLSEQESDKNEIEKLIEEAEHKQCQEQLRTVKECFQRVADGKPKHVENWAKQIRPKVLINELKIKNRVTNNQDEIIEELQKFYGNLYTADEVDNLKRFQTLRYFRKTLKEDDIAELERPITLYDIESAINKLRSNTSPCPDGLTAELYKLHRATFAKILLPVLQDALEGKKLPKSFSTSIISLIPKKPGLKNAKDFRPLSLINMDQKILSHVLTSRIRKIENLVGDDQFAYMKDRNMHRAIWDIQQRMLINGDSWCLVGLDCTKAFDRVDRKFMFQVLRKMNFPENFVKLVENIYQNTTAHMKINGYLTSKLKMTRGVRQGCPLSALLFIIALEPLIEGLRSHNWFTHDTERRAVAYADDINIFVHEKDLETLFERLKIFCEGTQFEVNQDKSTVLKRPSTSTQRVSFRAKVLGVHLSFNEESEIENKSKVRKILEDGAKFFNKYMSLYARALIMKTFLLPKLLHVLRHMKLDMKIFQDFKVFSKQALWGSKKSLVALEFLERSIKEGRIGWPNLMFEIMACKTLDLVGILASTDVASKNLLLDLWNRNVKYKNELRNEFRQVNINIMDITEQKIEASLELNPTQ